MSADGIYDPVHLAARWPLVWDRALSALTQLTGPVTGCRHVVEGSHPTLCARHPQAGLLCLEHQCVQQHSDEVHDAETACDACGKPVAGQVTGVAVICSVVPLAPEGLEVQSAADGSRRIEGLVVIGLGVCPACDQR